MRLRSLFKSKIHRATVTEANLAYEGSITMDADLMRAADIAPWEEVHIWDVTNGARLTTYAMEGPAGSGVICVNGAAAHLVRPGDIIIIATFCMLSEDSVHAHRPRVVLVDRANRITNADYRETPGPDSPDSSC